MRDTPFAREINFVSVRTGETEGRIERLFVKEAGQEKLRFSCWRQNRLVPSPLNLTEDELLTLISQGIKKGVLSKDFISRLRAENEI